MATTEQSTLERSEVSSPFDRKLWMFFLMWFGQLVSGIGSGLTTFAMGFGFISKLAQPLSLRR